MGNCTMILFLSFVSFIYLFISMSKLSKLISTNISEIVIKWKQVINLT